MKRMKKPAFALIIVMLLTMCLTGCSNTDDNTEKGVKESWAYNFDETKEVIRLNEDGTAMYQVKSFKDNVQVSKATKFDSYTKDDKYITLKNADTEIKLMYEPYEKGIMLYEKSTYKYSANSLNPQQDGSVLGLWESTGTDKLFYEFSDQGTFMEDGVFVGEYKWDKEAGTVTLNYYDEVPSTTFYYIIEGDIMTVDYPWPMVPYNKNGEKK